MSGGCGAVGAAKDTVADGAWRDLGESSLERASAAAAAVMPAGGRSTRELRDEESQAWDCVWRRMRVREPRELQAGGLEAKSYVVP